MTTISRTGGLAGHAASSAAGAAPVAHDWRAAGSGWGHAAADWACLFEQYSFDALVVVFTQLGVEAGMELLDIACGAGRTVMLAAGFDATVSGIDASAELVEIARERTPTADLRVGSMFELPWPDESFDAAMSINGIWGGCEDALVEAARVLRPGGLFAITFWGIGPPLDLRPCFKVFARHSPGQHVTSMRSLNDIATPGVAEEMLEAAGFEVVNRVGRVSTVEWPDAEVAWRALRSAGPAVPALTNSDPEVVRAEVMAAIAHCRDARGTYRFRNDHQIVIARKPAAPSSAGSSSSRPVSTRKS